MKDGEVIGPRPINHFQCRMSRIFLWISDISSAHCYENDHTE